MVSEQLECASLVIFLRLFALLVIFCGFSIPLNPKPVVIAVLKSTWSKSLTQRDALTVKSPVIINWNTQRSPFAPCMSPEHKIFDCPYVVSSANVQTQAKSTPKEQTKDQPKTVQCQSQQNQHLKSHQSTTPERPRAL